MINTCERLVVHCSLQDLPHYLAAFVAAHQLPDGNVRFAVRVPVAKCADRRPQAERPVIGKLSPLDSAGDAGETYSISWLPKGDGPSPEFTGTLRFGKNSQADRIDVTLSGRYTPSTRSGAVVGSPAGRRFAHVSVRDILHVIGNYIEHARAHSDAAFAGHQR